MPHRTAPTKYEKLTERDPERSSSDSTNDPLISPVFPRRSSSSRRNCLFLSIAFLMLFTFSVVQIILISQIPTKEPVTLDDAPCGETVEQARAKGCHYSFALGDWLHDECYDYELERQYKEEASTFEWYYPNAAGTGPDLSRRMKDWDELANQGFPKVSWTTWRFHVDHCLWAWKYVVKLGREGRRVSAGIARANHTDHCVHEIMDRTVKDEEIVTGHINGFPPCVTLKHYKKDHQFPYEIGYVRTPDR